VCSNLADPFASSSINISYIIVDEDTNVANEYKFTDNTGWSSCLGVKFRESGIAVLVMTETKQFRYILFRVTIYGDLFVDETRSPL